MKLTLVPTPIGNLKDITLRALDILQSVDVILAEDTRTSSILLKHYQIQKPLKSYHQHNEHKIVESLTEEIKSGKHFALITDAGTPAISDPGFLLVRACLQHDIPVECLPGATAFVPSLVVSGFPINRFIYEGFLPLKKGRHTLFTSWIEEERAIVFYESPLRLVKTLAELLKYLPENRLVCVCREMTKFYEEHRLGTINEVKTYYEKHTPKGEIVVVIKGK
ncbi:MAG: 16S rRNA (cytidine(1402)-2'-O)-methyltransferase [Chitinophagaceae bacterium]